MNSAQDVLNGGLLTPFTVARPSPPTTKEGAAAQREEKLKEQERAAAGRRIATRSIEETQRAQRRQLEDAEAYRTRQLMEIEGERPLPVSLPEFQSPRKTGEEMIGLLLVNAFATSALGKQNYLAAANAMTGAIRGYEAGKKTEYEQALKDFDVAVRKAVQEDKVNTAKYLQIANSKKMSVQDKFNLMRQEALRLDDKIMAAQLNTQQWDKVVAEVDRRLTAIDNTEREINREERRRVERAEERAQRRADRALDRADRAAEKEPKLYMATGPDGKPAMVRVTVDESGVARGPEGYTLTGEAAGGRGRGRTAEDTGGREPVTAIVRNQTTKDLNSIYSMIDVLEKIDDPVVRENWAKASVEFRRYLAELPPQGKEDSLLNRFIQQRSVQSLPAEVRQLVVEIASARNDYYKEKSGTAVSGTEARRNFGAVIQPTDNLDQLTEKALQATNASARRLEGSLKRYAFGRAYAEGIREDLEKLNSFRTPSAAAPAAAPSRSAAPAQLPPGIPQGSVLIGNTRPDAQGKSKKVYRGPDGKNYVPDE